MEKISVFSCDDPSLISLNECLLSSAWKEKISLNFPLVAVSSTHLVEEEGHKKEQVSLRVFFDREESLQLEDSHAIMHQWVLDVLQIQNGDDIFMSCVDKDMFVESPCRRVELDFIASFSLQNYDEMASLMSFGTDCVSPFGWLKDWPGYNIKILQSMLSTILFGACLVQDNLICIHILEHLVVFRVAFDTEDGHCDGKTLIMFVNKFDFQCHVDPHENDNNNNNNNVKENTEEISDSMEVDCRKLSFLDSCFNVLWKIAIKSLAMPMGIGVSSWQGPNSALIMSSKGSGKSSLLQSLVRQLRNSSYECFVLQFSGELITNDCDLSFIEGEAVPSARFVHFLRCLVDAFNSLDRSNALKLEQICDVLKEKGHLPPVCVIIDNIDSLVAKSEDSSSPTNKSFASSILRNMLYVLSSPLHKLPVCLIGSTSLNSHSSISPLFVGPPGFQHMITIPAPSYSDRCSLLLSFFKQNTKDVSSILGKLPLSFETEELGADTISTPKWRSNESVPLLVFEWISRASSLTAGFLPSDLRSIVKRAFSLSVGRQSQNSIDQHGEDLRSVKVEWADFIAAVTATTPQQLRAMESGEGSGIMVESRHSSLSWKDFAGYSHEKSTIRQILARSHLTSNSSESNPESRGRQDLMNAVGLHSPDGLVLWGPSGCGKSYIARIIAAECNMNFITVKSTAILSKFFGETEGTLRRLFQKARDASPCVLFFDEFDAIAHNRSHGDGESSVMARVLSTFLNELDGISSSAGKAVGSPSIFILAACESVKSLDQALVRPGRLSHHVKLDFPSDEDIGCLIRHYSGKLPLSDDLDIEELVTTVLLRRKECSSFGSNITCASVAAFCREAVQIAIRERIYVDDPLSNVLDISKYYLNDEADEYLHQRHFLQALETILPNDDFDSKSSIAKPSESNPVPVFNFSGNFSIGTI